MLNARNIQRYISMCGVLGIIVGALAMGQMWYAEKAANDQLAHQVRIMAQKSQRIVELERSATALVAELNDTSTEVVAATLSKAKLKNVIKKFPKTQIKPVAQNELSLSSKNPYEAVNAAVGGLSRVEKRLGRFVQSLEMANHLLESKKELLSGLPSVKPADGWISSGFGKRRAPHTGKWQDHKGLDIAAPLNSEVVASASGRIITAGWKGAYGKLVEIDHGQGIVTRYGHNAKLFVEEGDYVERGQKISTVGLTGRTTGAHLHYEVLVNDKPVDPHHYVNLAPMQHFGAEQVMVASSAHPAATAEALREVLMPAVDRTDRLEDEVKKALTAAFPVGMIFFMTIFMLRQQRLKRFLRMCSTLFAMPFEVVDSLLAQKSPEFDGAEPVNYWGQPEPVKVKSNGYTRAG